jgi:hypothetical protein
MPSSVSWRYDHTTEPWLRWCLLAGVAVLFGAYLGMVLAAAVSLALVLVAGSVELRLLVVLLALVGGPFSLLYLLPMIRDPDQRPTLYPEGAERRLLTRERVVAGVVGAVVLAVAFRVEPLLAGGLFVTGALAGLVAVLCSTRGRIDPETGTVETGEREWNLSRVTGYSVRRIGPLAVVSLDASGPGRFGTVPSRIAVPVPVLDDATAALDRVVAEADGTSGREPNPTVRVVAAAIAVLFAGGGVAAAVFVDSFDWFVAAYGLLFASLFALVAREG